MNAYRSVRSAVGSLAIRGASRWLDAFAFLAAFGVSAAAPIANAAIPVIAAAVTALLRIVYAFLLGDRRPQIHLRSHPFRCGVRFGRRRQFTFREPFAAGRVRFARWLSHARCWWWTTSARSPTS